MVECPEHSVKKIIELHAEYQKLCLKNLIFSSKVGPKIVPYWAIYSYTFSYKIMPWSETPKFRLLSLGWSDLHNFFFVFFLLSSCIYLYPENKDKS